MKGKLYGIGVGPGDPELLTMKAVRALRACDVVAAPKSGSGEAAALAIVSQYIDGKELLECRFPMDKDAAKRKAARTAAADQIAARLDQGKTVGFVTLGDPTTYSTYMYVHELLAPRYETEIVPGVTSYAAAAAAFGVALCEGDETLTIVPAAGEKLDALLNLPGNKVIMKSGENLSRVLQQLKARGYGDRTRITYRAAMDGQRLYNGVDEYERSPEAGYFTLAIVKEEK